MNFSQDYTKFFDLNPYKTSNGFELDTTDPQFVVQHRYDLTKNDFVRGCAGFLTEYDILQPTATAIAYAVFERMADQRLHYHTPVHVLSMFQFAEREFPDQAFAPWEELAIWFHDSVYIPQLPGTNEELSAQFMHAMVGPAFTNSELSAAQFAIETTAQHLDSVTNPLYDTIMDLDLVALSWTDSIAIRGNCIRKEFDYIDDETYNKNRKAFLNRLLSKGFIFRSPEFKDRYEAITIENIKRDLENV